MAHESFEDPETAELMNRLFVNIKVDREERPDLDSIYQTAHSLLTQRSGGWPLTVFLTPDDHAPFFAGTYFPPEPRHGMPSFRELMQRIVDFLGEHREDILRQNSSLIDALATINHSGSHAAMISSQPLDVVRQQLEQSFDERHGGFGEAPKFPHPTNIERLLRHWDGTRESGMADRRSLHMAVFTLEQMAQGGMYDQLGGGFCRYSVDDRWMIPHFEKMLYDNGALLALYAEAWAITGNALFRRVCEQTAAWTMREMQSGAGGYYSSLDADSEGEEGRFYVWTPEEVRTLLDDGQYRLLARHFGLDRPANFEGAWHLHTFRTREELAQELSLDPETVDGLIDVAREKLLKAREQRIRPGRDDKVLTSWNGLMIRGMAIAGRLLERHDWIDSAERAVDFIRDTLWQNGRLLATCKDGRAHLNAYLDDHVYLIDGLLELLQARWRASDLDFAIELAELVLSRFQDADGGFFFTSDDHEQLIQRPKPNHDDATPSGNGIAAKVLARLGHLLGEARYIEASERTLKGLWPSLENTPYGHSSLLVALEESLSPGQGIILRGSPAAMQEWRGRLDRSYGPRRQLLSIPVDAGELPGVLAERRPQDDTVAYICEGLSCRAPVTDKAEFNNLTKTTP
jgi:hypothetical protein